MLLADESHLQRVRDLLDEDMTPMHMTMFGAWDGGEGGQQGFPSQEGGPRLIRFESPRLRPKATKVRARLGVQEQHVLKMTSRSHMVSVLGVLYMGGRIILGFHERRLDEE